MSRAALAAGRQAGLSNPNQDSFLPLGDTDSFKGKKGPAYQVLATRSRRSAVHTMALVTAHLHFVGGAHGAGHPEKHPGPPGPQKGGKASGTSYKSQRPPSPMYSDWFHRSMDILFYKRFLSPARVGRTDSPRSHMSPPHQTPAQQYSTCGS